MQKQDQRQMKLRYNPKCVVASGLVVGGPGAAEGGPKTGIFIESPRGARGNPPKHKGDRGDAFWRVSHYGNRVPRAHFHLNAIGSLNIRDSAPQINRAFYTAHMALEHWPNKAQGQIPF